MPGLLNHSPADIVRRVLITLGLGTDPADAAAWPIYAAGEPSSPDAVITLTDTQGIEHGRQMVDGLRQEHHGFQVRVRAPDHKTGYVKARAIAVALDASIYRVAIALDGTTYCVHSVTRTSDVIPLGKEIPTSKRSLFVVNATVYLKQVTS